MLKRLFKNMKCEFYAFDWSIAKRNLKYEISPESFSTKAHAEALEGCLINLQIVFFFNFF